MDNIIRKRGPTVRITIEQALEMRRKYKEGARIKDICAEFKVSRTVVVPILNGKWFERNRGN